MYVRRLSPSIIKPRRGAAALDYVLVFSVTLPVLTIVIPIGMRMMRAVWELTCLQVAWPFL